MTLVDGGPCDCCGPVGCYCGQNLPFPCTDCGGIPPCLCLHMSFPNGALTFDLSRGTDPTEGLIAQNIYDYLTQPICAGMQKGFGFNSCPDGRPLWSFSVCQDDCSAYKAFNAYNMTCGDCDDYTDQFQSQISRRWFCPQTDCVPQNNGGDIWLLGARTYIGDPVLTRYTFSVQDRICWPDPCDPDCSGCWRLDSCSPYSCSFHCWIYSKAGEFYTGPMYATLTECVGPSELVGQNFNPLAANLSDLSSVVYLSGAADVTLDRSADGWAGGGYSVSTDFRLYHGGTFLGRGSVESTDPLYVSFGRFVLTQ